MVMFSSFSGHHSFLRFAIRKRRRPQILISSLFPNFQGNQTNHDWIASPVLPHLNLTYQNERIKKKKLNTNQSKLQTHLISKEKKTQQTGTKLAALSSFKWKRAFPNPKNEGKKKAQHPKFQPPSPCSRIFPATKHGTTPLFHKSNTKQPMESNCTDRLASSPPTSRSAGESRAQQGRETSSREWAPTWFQRRARESTTLRRKQTTRAIRIQCPPSGARTRRWSASNLGLGHWGATWIIYRREEEDLETQKHCSIISDYGDGTQRAVRVLVCVFFWETILTVGLWGRGNLDGIGGRWVAVGWGPLMLCGVLCTKYNYIVF